MAIDKLVDGEKLDGDLTSIANAIRAKGQTGTMTIEEMPERIGAISGGGASNHNELSNRDLADQHPISAITGLNGAIDGKIDKNVMESTPVDIGMEITPSETVVAITHHKKNIVTGATSSEQDSMPIANGSQVGMMTPEQVGKIEELESRVGGLEGQNVRLSYTASAAPTAEQIRQFVVNLGYSDISRWGTIGVVVKSTNHIWRYYSNTQAWEDIGLDTVQQASQTVSGIVKGSSNNGKIFVEADGTMSLNGYDEIKDDISNLQTGKADDADLQSHIENKENPHEVTKDQVGLGNVDNTSDNTKKANFKGSIAKDNTGFVTGGDVHDALAGKIDKNMTASASTTAAGTPATASYDPVQNRMAFTIPKGDTGDNGNDGKTAYQSAIEGGYTGTELQFNSDLANVSRPGHIINYAILTAASWVADGDEYTQTVNADYISTDYDYVVDAPPTYEATYGYNGIKAVSMADGSMVFTARSLPTVDIQIRITEWR